MFLPLISRFYHCGSCDVFLGTQWIRTLGLIQWAFQQLTMGLSHKGKDIMLYGLRPIAPIFQEGEQIFKPATRKGLILQILGPNDQGSQEVHEERINELLKKFEKVCETFTELPFTKGHEHQIILKDGAQPICVRPYRFPYY
jgi:hypothetical protein